MGNYTQEEQNFLVFIQALKYSTIGLKTYVDQCMDDLHGRLKRKIGSNQACSNRCNVTQWCNTCAAWKREIEKYVRHKSPRNKVLWKDIELWKLSGTNYEGAKIELCRIFVRDSRMITFDIQNILSILQNCRYFVIGEDTKRLEAFRNVRNIDFAHTDCFKMSSRRLKRVISSILHFLQHPSLEGSQCISTTVTDIQGLRKGSKHSLAQLEVYNAFHNLRQISEIDINDFLSINNEDNNGPHRHHTFVIFLMFVAILVGMSVISLKIPWDDITNGEEKYSTP